MSNLRKGTTITGPGGKRCVVTGWDAANVYAQLIGGNPDVDYYSLPRETVAKGVGQRIGLGQQRRRPQSPDRRVNPDLIEEGTLLHWRHRAPADL